MKRNLTIFTLLSFIFISLLINAKSLKPQEKAKLIEHLSEVNQFWNQHRTDLPVLELPIAFKNESDRIQMHLLLVKNILEHKPNLRNSAFQSKRLELLEHLETYANTGLFPRNTRHPIRIPYFVDDYKTPCAVGELLLYSGEKNLVERIKSEDNYAYLREMDFPELGVWADNHGFTADELAWIQPGYPPSFEAWEPLGTGINDGSVNAMVTYNDMIVMVGEFAVANNLQVSNVVAWDGNDYVMLGDGFDGNANCATVHDGKLWLGGLFNNFVSDLAIWDGSTWTYESVFSSKLGFIDDLLSMNGELYAAGYATGIAGESHFVAQRDGNSWTWIKQFDGTVRTLENYDGKLSVAGDFSSYWVGNVQVQANRAAILENGNWNPLGTNLDNNIYELQYHLGTNQLFASGLTQDEAMNPTMGLLVYDGEWNGEVPIETFYTGITEPVISHMFSNEQTLYLTGWFGIQNGISFGDALGSVNLTDTVSYVVPHFVSNDAVNTGVIFQDELYIGGKFTSLTGNNFDRVAKLSISTNIPESVPFKFSIAPNPASDLVILQSEMNFKNDWTIQLLSLDGKRVSPNFQINEERVEISLAGMASGTYLLLIEENGLVINSAKLIVR